MRILVTVGSTFFDPLIAATSSIEFQEAALSLGFNQITLQIGTGEPPDANNQVTGIVIDYLRFTNDLRSLMLASHVIICHAGAGTLLEALRLPPLEERRRSSSTSTINSITSGDIANRRSVITVVNESLMDNHQYELASQLAAMGFLNNSSLERLTDTLRQSCNERQRTSLTVGSITTDFFDLDESKPSSSQVRIFPTTDKSLLPFLLDSEFGFLE